MVSAMLVTDTMAPPTFIIIIFTNFKFYLPRVEGKYELLHQLRQQNVLDQSLYNHINNDQFGVHHVLNPSNQKVDLTGALDLREKRPGERKNQFMVEAKLLVYPGDKAFLESQTQE